MNRLTMLGALAVLAMWLGAAASPAAPSSIELTLGPQASGPVSGRLIILAMPAARVQMTVAVPGANGAPPTQVARTLTNLNYDGTFIATQKIKDWRPGTPLRLDLAALGKPGPLSALPAGSYGFQAILDRNDNYAQTESADEGDLATGIVIASLPGSPPALVFDKAAVPVTDPRTMDIPAGVKLIDFVSPSLTAFHKTPTHVRGWVALPPGYETGAQTYPVVYEFGGWSANLRYLLPSARTTESQMVAGRLPPVIWVFLDHKHDQGTHEFADSANNGPWGKALTQEVIPWLETAYRADNRPGSRFLTGHSSGGWAALWVQVAYPKLFGGTWPTSPDPSAFSDFSGIDIYAPNANFYRDAAGKPWPMFRAGTTTIETFEQTGKREAVLGLGGAYLSSYEWVFGPKGRDGPRRLFDRQTGVIDPVVARYWRDHYDINYIIGRDWTRLKPDLDGKIHLTVGEADNYLYNGPAHVLKATLDRAGAKSDFTFVPNGDHGIRTQALVTQLAQQMYAIARPGSGWAPTPAPPATPRS